MRHARVFVLAGLAVAVVTAAYAAQTTVVPIPDNEPVETAPLEVDLGKTHWGDAEAGQAKAATCAACHGPDGKSIDPTMYPHLAGQSERYIARQLALFASGERHTGMAAVMVPFAQALSPQDMRDVGAYFAQLPAPAGVADDAEVTDGPYAGMKFYEIGQKLYRGGDPERGIPACMACHGPSGAGNPGPAYPAVNGQDHAYVARRLEEYRTGTTTAKDAAHFKLMASVAKSLTDEEIQSLGSYVQGLHARSAGASKPASAH